jgi:hypothetical protein
VFAKATTTAAEKCSRPALNNEKKEMRTPQNQRRGVTALCQSGLRVSPEKSEPTFSDKSEAMNESFAVPPAKSEHPPIVTVILRPLPVCAAPGPGRDLPTP